MADQIIVSKFGGSSMADEAAMDRSAKIAQRQNSSIVLVSATYGTTDKLLELIKTAQEGNWPTCEKLLFNLREKHFDILGNFTNDTNHTESLKALLKELETLSRGIFLLKECSDKARDQLLSLGERMSSLLFSLSYKNLFPEKDVVLLDARDVIITDDKHTKARPQIDLIERKAKEVFNFAKQRVYISQGFIGKTEAGHTTTLGRGGSDYSAALFAQAVNANVLEIWTDVAGIASTDPRICKAARPIHEISYDEASEMAQYGAKILHPTTLVPAMQKNIPVFVGSSYEGDAKGTWIRQEVKDKPLIRALAKRSDQALLTIRTPKMLNAVGFMGNIFGVFSNHQISVDCVTTSEISVSVSIDRSVMEHKALIKDLEAFGEVSFETGQALISLIGNKILSTHGLAKDLFNALGEINVRMMCLGASAHNFNLLVAEQDCNVAVQRLHQKFIEACN
tara:strand:- start:1893 stop:3248 length:1356 start_codon:yes stop_codon:yes gene_type:complete